MQRARCGSNESCLKLIKCETNEDGIGDFLQGSNDTLIAGQSLFTELGELRALVGKQARQLNRIKQTIAEKQAENRGLHVRISGFFDSNLNITEISPNENKNFYPDIDKTDAKLLKLLDSGKKSNGTSRFIGNIVFKSHILMNI